MQKIEGSSLVLTGQLSGRMGKLLAEPEQVTIDCEPMNETETTKMGEQDMQEVYE